VTQAALKQSPGELLWGRAGEFRSGQVLDYVMWSFPWDTEPSIQLVKLVEPWASRYNCEWGPDAWCCEFFDWLGHEIHDNAFDPLNPGECDIPVIQMSMKSGHGVGKGAGVGMLGCYLMDTRQDSMGIVTANTGAQLRTKTFAEIIKWREMSQLSRWWQCSLGDLYIRNTMNPAKWRLDGMTWREHLAQAFAGLHAAHSTPYIIGDEASTIPEVILGTAQGGLTDGEAMMFLFGNPTDNKGYFYETFHKNKHRWHNVTVDSRDVQITNKVKLQEWIDDNGEDSDYVRIRVKGEFPRSGTKQFIDHDLVDDAIARVLPDPLRDTPVVVGIDVARFGGDESVIAVRRGPDARTIPWKQWRGLDTMQLASRAAIFCDELVAVGWPPAAVFVDGTGVGAGVVDRLLQLGYPVVEVNFGGRADDREHYGNRSAEMWGLTKKWLEGQEACLAKDNTLADQLCNRDYSYSGSMQLLMEKKDDMRDRSLESPDRADALVLTFAYPVAPQTMEETDARRTCMEDADFDPLGTTDAADFDPLEVN